MTQVVATYSSTKPEEQSYKFVFVVKATSWDDVAEIFKSELGIIQKRNASGRKINGLYLVSCTLKQSELTKDFYEKVIVSSKIAIHTDEKSTTLYPMILEETQIIEERLRWLLLHVSDAVEGFVEIIGYKDKDIIETGRLDPLTSGLSFEAMLDLLDIDWSWARTGVDIQRMRLLVESSTDFNRFKQEYLAITTPKTVWESISDLVLERPLKWGTIKPRLKSIKTLRNKCAHFYTVTDDDYSQARVLREQLVQNLTKKSTITPSDIKAVLELSKQLTETIKVLTQSYTESFKTLNTGARIMQETFGAINGGFQSAIIGATRPNISVLKSLFESYSKPVDLDLDELADESSDDKTSDDKKPTEEGSGEKSDDEKGEKK